MSTQEHRDDVDLDGALDALADELPQANQGIGVEIVALRRWYGALRDAAPETVTVTDLRDVAVAHDLARYYRRPSDLVDAVADYLDLLPGVVREGPAGWRYDREAQRNRPEPPADPTPPANPRDGRAVTHPEAKAVLDDVADRFANPVNRSKNVAALRDAYVHLVDVGAGGATTTELLEASGYETSTPPASPEAGLFATREAWFREVGRGALSKLPGVVPPAVAGEDWVFVGVDADHPEA